MKKPQINYSQIDSGIRGLVRLLNEIPFVATQFSCEGHSKDRDNTGFLSDSGCKFLYGGDMTFKVDMRHPRAKDFLADVTCLKETYSFVNLYVHHCQDYDCSIEGSYALDFGYLDLTHTNTIKDDDTLETMIKKRHQVPIAVGEKRIAEYEKIWKDVGEIARTYIPASVA